MEYSAWHSVIQDGNGAVVPMAKITVRNTSTGALAKLYSARDGSAPKANPFNADENGQVFFFVAGGSYTIKAEFGSQERTWPFVPVGTAAEYDIDSLAQYLNSGVVYFQNGTALTAYVPLSYPAAAVVLADPDALKNGYYTNSGTGWIFGRALQDTISRLFITGGAVNTPTATIGQGINPSAPLVFYVDVTVPNTASVTLNVVGLGQGVVLNVAGNPLAAGEWLGRVMLTRETDGRYRIMNDPASALSAAQSATASDSARAASVTAKTQSETARDQSVVAKTQSEDAKTASETARDQSVTAKNQSDAARDQSVTAKNQSVSASESSGRSAVAAAASENNAAASAGAASSHASSANTSKNQTATSATTSTNEADRAKTEADRAAAAAGGLISAVQFVPQTLTVAQQTQARNNIGVQPVNSASVGAAIATPTPSETIADGDRLSGLDPTGTGLKLFRFSAVKTWIQSWLTKAMVGLGNVANKSEAQMVESGAIADALEGKLPSNAQAADSARLGNKTAVQWQTEVDALKNQFFGNGQVWQSVSRPANTVFQNTTGRTIFITVNISSGYGTFQMSPDNVNWSTAS
ncbi:MAG: carboxypeptidase-like regulatory domain-containing protein, partial [Brucellaceae bacterium]|nr:carboxypeptidase-like regulatory domain-containing protein [Brucellaceae bacterium]